MIIKTMEPGHTSRTELLTVLGGDCKHKKRDFFEEGGGISQRSIPQEIVRPMCIHTSPYIVQNLTFFHFHKYCTFEILASYGTTTIKN